MAGSIRPTSPRRRRWRRFLERQTLVRHPVSLTRQRGGAALLTLLSLGTAWYAYTTSDEAIRRRAAAFLTEVTAGEVRVDRARFRMFDGITLYDVDTAELEPAQGPPFADRAKTGFIGLQTHGSANASPDESFGFRNVFVQEL